MKLQIILNLGYTADSLSIPFCCLLFLCRKNQWATMRQRFPIQFYIFQLKYLILWQSFKGLSGSTYSHGIELETSSSLSIPAS